MSGGGSETGASRAPSRPSGSDVPASVRALLGRIVDYAGLFPPAKLPLDEAIRGYASHRRAPEAWMLSRFVCPVDRLADLDRYGDELFGGGEPFRFSVLLSGGESAGAFRETLLEDLVTIARFRRRHAAGVVVDVAEARFPRETLESGDDVVMTKFLNDVATTIDRKGPPELVPFYEADLSSGWERALPVLIEAIQDHNRARDAIRARDAAPELRAGNAGFKLRTGGMTGDAFPSPEDVSVVMALCRDRSVRMKFTAGLHHPLRRFDETQNVEMHGFLNVFTAGVMAWEHKLEPPRIRQILEDAALAGFAFDEERLSWKGYTVPTSRVSMLRRDAVVSFGSCSFDEPRDDLRTLSLLPA